MYICKTLFIMCLMLRYPGQLTIQPNPGKSKCLTTFTPNIHMTQKITCMTTCAERCCFGFNHMHVGLCEQVRRAHREAPCGVRAHGEREQHLPGAIQEPGEQRVCHQHQVRLAIIPLHILEQVCFYRA